MSASPQSRSPEPLLEARGLVKHYPVGGAMPFGAQPMVRAVDGVSFTLEAGRTLGLVGESGCGKSSLARLVVRLEEATAGSLLFGGRDITTLSGEAMRAVRREMQIVFQDPYASLNPRMTVARIVGEPYAIHGVPPGGNRDRLVAELLDAVGLPATYASRHPHEFSGGQRQRIGLARALALRPKLIVCDEPVSALDVSIQAQILNLLKDLQKRYGLSYLFIGHGLAALRHVSHDVGVMYLGKLVEKAPVRELFARPAHPYTQALLSAIPVPDPRAPRNRIVLQGDVPSPVNPPSGCRFHTRCPMAAKVGERCRTQEPRAVTLSPGHTVSCHPYDDAPGAARPET